MNHPHRHIPSGSVRSHRQRSSSAGTIAADAKRRTVSTCQRCFRCRQHQPAQRLLHRPVSGRKCRHQCHRSGGHQCLSAVQGKRHNELACRTALVHLHGTLTSKHSSVRNCTQYTYNTGATMISGRSNSHLTQPLRVHTFPFRSNRAAQRDRINCTSN